MNTEPASASDLATLTAIPPGSLDELVCAFLPESEQLLARTVMALRRTILALGETTSPANELQLGWWHQELARLAQNEPRHPLTKALERYVRSGAIDAAWLLEYLTAAAARQRLEVTETVSELRLDGFRRDGVSMLVFLGALSDSPSMDSPGYPRARHVGIALGIERILDGARADLARGCVVLPVSLAEERGLTPDEPAVWPDQRVYNGLLRDVAEIGLAELEAGPVAQTGVAIIDIFARVTGVRLAGWRNRGKPVPVTFRLLWSAWRAATASNRYRRAH